MTLPTPEDAARPRRRRATATRTRRARLTPGEVLDRLTAAYGAVEWSPRRNTLDGLVLTVLSQHTSDLNAGRAFKTLRERFPTWEQVLDADTAEVAEHIRQGGLANQKAPRIQAILDEILRRRGSLDLEFLEGLPLEEARAWLTSMPGVGPKTAAVVLLFSLGMPAMPVDTHVYRVSRRLGLIPFATSVEKAHRLMERQVLPRDVYRYHVLLITHGRRTCRAQRPLCGGCALREGCPAAPAFEKAQRGARYRRPARGGKPL